MALKLRFTLANGLTPDDIDRAKYLIYAHQCDDDVYVGMSYDPVTRWFEHQSAAENSLNPSHNATFKAVIRASTRFKHYIVAIASTESAAASKKAAAIVYYSNLNMKYEAPDREYPFKPLASSIQTMEINVRRRLRIANSRNDGDRKMCLGEIYIDCGRKHVRSLANEYFPAGLMVQCARDERERFKAGDRVKIKVALSKKRGADYLVAASTSKLVPA